MTKKLRSEPAKPRPSAKLTELTSAAAHRETAQYEEDNIGVEAANRVTEAAEDGVRYASKLSARPRRELKTEPHGVKQQQKRGIKDAYAKARRGKYAASRTHTPRRGVASPRPAPPPRVQKRLRRKSARRSVS